NSGPLTAEIQEQEGTPVAVLSGNRNFPGRVHPDLDYGFLMSPPVVIAFALAGRAAIDSTDQSFGTDHEGGPVLVSGIWPDTQEGPCSYAIPGRTRRRWLRSFPRHCRRILSRRISMKPPITGCGMRLKRPRMRCFPGMRSPRYCARRHLPAWTKSPCWEPMMLTP